MQFSLDHSTIIVILQSFTQYFDQKGDPHNRVLALVWHTTCHTTVHLACVMTVHVIVNSIHTWSGTRSCALPVWKTVYTHDLTHTYVPSPCVPVP